MDDYKNRRQFLSSSAAVLAGLSLSGCATIGYQEKTDHFFDVVKNRRSVRNYKDTPVPEKDILKILEMASLCPTAGNRQPWKFVVMQDRKAIQGMRDMIVDNRVNQSGNDQVLGPEEAQKRRNEVDAGYNGYFSAPVFIGVCTDNEARHAASMNPHDGPIVSANICLIARAMGYGTVYLTGSIPSPAFRAAARVPDRYDICCVIALGIPTEWPDMPAKKPLQEMLIMDRF